MPWRKRFSFEFGGGGYRCPLERTDFRTLDPLFADRIFTWDIDQTYLRTNTRSLRHLLRIPFELAVDKEAISGTVPLLKGIRRGRAWGQTAQTPLYFVSASPPQLRSVIEKKMLLDGIEFDGITFKNQLAHLARGRLDKLKEQVGYKLSALLLNRRAHPPAAREILFGDDTEADPFIYTTYSRIVSGELRGGALRALLLDNKVDALDAEYVRVLSDGMSCFSAVERVFIHRWGLSRGEWAESDYPEVLFTTSPFQAAVALWETDYVDDETVSAVARECGKFPELKDALDDGVMRQIFEESTCASVSKLLEEHGLGV